MQVEGEGSNVADKKKKKAKPVTPSTKVGQQNMWKKVLGPFSDKPKQ